MKLSEEDFYSVFEGVEQFEISRIEIEQGVSIVDFTSEKTKIFPSKGESKKMIQGGGVSVNKLKIDDIEFKITSDHLINDKYVLIQKGKKNYFVIKVN